MKDLHELKEKLCRELDEYSRNPEMKAGDLEVIHKLTDTIKNINKIEMLEEEGGYSGDDGYNSYDRGSSYSNRGKHYVRGHYSRDMGRRTGTYRRYDNGGYSGDDGRSEMMEYLEKALDAASEQDREDIKRFMRKLENI